MPEPDKPPATTPWIRRYLQMLLNDPILEPEPMTPELAKEIEEAERSMRNPPEGPAIY